MPLSLKQILVGTAAVIGLGLGALFYVFSQPAALPDRPPTFDEIMALADQNRATNSLVESYIHGQDDGVGFDAVMKRAQTGDIEAELMACYLLTAGLGVEKNDAVGYPLCELAASKGSTQAKANLIYRDFNDDPETMNWTETHAAFVDLLKTNPSTAHRGLQFLYRQDHPKASMRMMFYHLDRAIEHKSTNAMLGRSEFDLNIIPEHFRNPERAEKTLQKAYALNDFEAGFWLALQYREGNKIEQDLPRYQAMIERMAAFRHPASVGELAFMYATGKGVDRDDDKSNALYAQAAAAGNAYAQEMIGTYFLFGPEDERDYDTGLHYLVALAEAGNIDAMIALAKYYETPEIDDPNNQYLLWLAQAAMYGDEGTQDRLGFGMMETGYIEQMQPYIQFLEAGHAYGDPDASYLLARHYRAASGVKRDLRKAQKILNAVAHLDNPRVTEEIDVIDGYISHFGSIDAVPDIIKL